MLKGEVCFYFSFVFAICSSKMKTRHVTRNLFTEKVLSRWDNFNSRDNFHIITELSLLCFFVIRNLLRIFILTCSTTFCPSGRVWEGSREFKLKYNYVRLSFIVRSSDLAIITVNQLIWLPILKLVDNTQLSLTFLSSRN